MSTKFYTGTKDQAFAFANDYMRQRSEDNAEAQKYNTIEDALDNLTSEIDDLVYTLRNANRDQLLDAIYKFAYVHSALNIVEYKVNQAYDADDNSKDE